jgi:hypothetical protein
MTDESVFNVLSRWLVTHGGKVDGLHFKQISENHRGVCADRDLCVGEELLVVPPGAFISKETALGSRTGSVLGASDRDFSIHTLIAVFLLEEKKKQRSSYWFRYISIIPEDYTHMPQMMNKKQRKFLRGSMCMEMVNRRNMYIMYEYNNIKQVLPDFPFSLREFQWARMAVLSRVFGIIIGTQKATCLVPIADMLNHSAKPSTRWTYNNKKKAFTLTVIEPVRQGGEVFDTYGAKPASDLLVNYGFCTEDSVIRACEVRGGDRLFKIVDYPYNDKLISHMEKLFTATRNTSEFNCPTRIEYEISILFSLYEMTETKIRGYPRPLEQYHELLRNRLTFSKRSCILAVISELSLLTDMRNSFVTLIFCLRPTLLLQKLHVSFLLSFVIEIMKGFTYTLNKPRITSKIQRQICQLYWSQYLVHL